MLTKSSGKSKGFTCHKWIPFPTHRLRISSHTQLLLWTDRRRQPRCCFCYQTHWFDFKARKAFTFARTALHGQRQRQRRRRRQWVCSLTKDTYICMHCILQILAGSCLCLFGGPCATFFSSFSVSFCLVRFKCRNFNAAHITTPAALPRLWRHMHSVLRPNSQGYI